MPSRLGKPIARLGATVPRPPAPRLAAVAATASAVLFLLHAWGAPAALAQAPGAAPTFQLKAAPRESPEGVVVTLSGSCDAPEGSNLAFVAKFGGQAIPEAFAAAQVDAQLRIVGQVGPLTGKRFPRGLYTIEAHLDPAGQDPSLAWYFSRQPRHRIVQAEFRLGTPMEERRGREEARRYHLQVLESIAGFRKLLTQVAGKAASADLPLREASEPAEELRSRVERLRTSHRKYAELWACHYYADLTVTWIGQMLDYLDLLQWYHLTQAHVVRGLRVPQELARPEYGEPDAPATEALLAALEAQATGLLESRASREGRSEEDALSLYPEDFPKGSVPALVPDAAVGVLQSNPGRLTREELLRLPAPGVFLRQIPPQHLLGVYYAGLRQEGAVAAGEPQGVVEVLVCDFAAKEWCAAAGTRLEAQTKRKPGASATGDTGAVVGAVFTRERTLVAILPRGNPPAALVDALVELYRERMERK